jgi:hypothetical protein
MSDRPNSAARSTDARAPVETVARFTPHASSRVEQRDLSTGVLCGRRTKPGDGPHPWAVVAYANLFDFDLRSDEITR